MKRLTLLVILFSSASAGAWSCSCAGVNLRDAIRDSTAIFLGRVLTVTRATISSGDGSHRDPGYRVWFSVRTSWKGDMGGITSVLTSEVDDRCGYPFKSGKEYLVFVGRAYGDGPWITSRCGYTSDPHDPRDTKASYALAELGRGTPRSPPDTGLLAVFGVVTAGMASLFVWRWNKRGRKREATPP